MYLYTHPLEIEYVWVVKRTANEHKYLVHTSLSSLPILLPIPLLSMFIIPQDSTLHAHLKQCVLSHVLTQELLNGYFLPRATWQSAHLRTYLHLISGPSPNSSKSIIHFSWCEGFQAKLLQREKEREREGWVRREREGGRGKREGRGGEGIQRVGVMLIRCSREKALILNHGGSLKQRRGEERGGEREETYSGSSRPGSIAGNFLSVFALKNELLSSSLGIVGALSRYFSAAGTIWISR